MSSGEDMQTRRYDGDAGSWREVYRATDPFSRKIQRRRGRVLAAVERCLGDRRVRILDAGCGTGEVARRLQARGHQVVAMDYSSDMLAEASRGAREAGAIPRFIRGSVPSLPFRDATFDAVVCVGVLGHFLRARLGDRVVDAEDRALGELRRVLRPGGFMVLTVPNLLRLHWILDPGKLRSALRWRREADRRQLPPGTDPERLDMSACWSTDRNRQRTPAELRRALARLGLRVRYWDGVGFGPFTLLGRRLFSADATVRLSEALEGASRFPLLRLVSRLAGTLIVTVDTREGAGATKADA